MCMPRNNFIFGPGAPVFGDLWPSLATLSIPARLWFGVNRTDPASVGLLQTREDVLRPFDTGFDVGKISGLGLGIRSSTPAARARGALRTPAAGARIRTTTTAGAWRRQFL